jgi:chemotaxis methyl-accepting protein methylase
MPALWARRPEPQPLRALSAGCGAGEEAWTLGMLLLETAPRAVGAAPRARILGVDRDEALLATARAASYDSANHQSLPRELAQRFLQPAVDGSARIVPELQALVNFQHHDLTSGVPGGRYALIICKNVLSHLADDAQEHLAQSLRGALTSDGVLLVARSEIPLVLSLGARPHELAPGITAFRPP